MQKHKDRENQVIRDFGVLILWPQGAVSFILGQGWL